jgi:sugar/nucleoside kinase (ribokinase family)
MTNEKKRSDNIGISYIYKEAYDFDSFPDYKLVDTTGAGDAFTASFAVGFLENKKMELENSEEFYL